MTHVWHILADSEELPVKGLVFVVVLIIWGISALANAAKKTTEQQKERMRKVREAIEQSQQAARQQMPQQAGRPPVQLAPEIQRRIPPPVVTRPQPQRKPIRRPILATKKRVATNYNALTAKKPAPPPPLPAAKAVPEVVLVPETAPPPPMLSTSRKSTGVSAAAITMWLTPATLRQQFMLTEIFQPPIALREAR
jgi:Sec-independent protein translocase protein TatA